MLYPTKECLEIIEKLKREGKLSKDEKDYLESLDISTWYLERKTSITTCLGYEIDLEEFREEIKDIKSGQIYVEEEEICLVNKSWLEPEDIFHKRIKRELQAAERRRKLKEGREKEIYERLKRKFEGN